MRRSITAYVLSAVALVAAVLLRWLLDPALGDSLPLVTLFAAVAAAVWLGGYLPAIVVAALGYLACNYLFIHPRGSLDWSDDKNLFGVLAYTITSTVIIALGQVARFTRRLSDTRRESLLTTLSSIGDAVIATDSSGRILLMNPVAVRLTGWASSEAVGQPLEQVFRIFNEETRQAVSNPIRAVLEQGGVQSLANHTILVARDGTEWPIDDSAAPIRGEGSEIVGCVLVFRDVTARRRAEQSTARLAAIVGSSDDAIISKDLNGIILSWNAGAELLFGYTADETIGKPVTMLIPPEQVDEEPKILERLRRGERIEHYETIRRHKDGTLLDISLSVSPLADSSGKIVGASKIARDITARKRAERALLEADQRKDEFLAMLAHELRNPLTSISHAMQLLRIAAEDPKVLRSVSEILQRQVGQMRRFVDDLLDVSRITRGRIELRREPLALGPLIEQTVVAARPLAETMEHELEVILSPEPLYVDADPVRLSQVVSNLINNACKFTDRGGRITVRVASEGGQAVIRVRDTGIGIAAEDLSRIFGLFTQVDTSLERSVGGLGIGLTLIQKLVSMHGGTVEAQSAGKGQGSEFIVRLPLASAPQLAPATPTARVDTAVTPRRILLVDDNRDSAESLALALELGGHEIHTVHNGQDALLAAERIRPDVVLLDIGLPKMNGYEVCQRIRQLPWGSEPVVVAVTGWGQDEARQKSREAGFDTHVVKPVDYAALMKLLASVEPTSRP
jgi:PAS domain S-box-containing protein